MKQEGRLLEVLRARYFCLGLSWVMVLCSCQHVTTSRTSDGFRESDIQNGYYSGKVDRQSASFKVDYQNQPKKKALILDFWNDTPVKIESLGRFAGSELRRGLLLTERVIYPADVKEDLKTESYVDGEQIKVEQLIREGRRMGVSVALLGRIRKISFRQKGDDIGVFRKKQSLVGTEVEIKVFDVQQGKEILASSKSGETNADTLVVADDQKVESLAFKVELTKLAVREALAGFIPEMVTLIDKMKWQGRIAKIIGPKVFLNAGHQTGLMNGDILTVMSAGEEIFDPQTGASLGRSPGRPKGTLEVIEQMGLDASVAQVHTGSNFTEGDWVQLY